MVGPNAPSHITVLNETTTSMILNIRHGIGMVQYYEVTIEKNIFIQYLASRKENTVVKIDDLKPGTLYNSFTIVAVSHGFNSSSIVIPPHATSKFQLQF